MKTPKQPEAHYRWCSPAEWLLEKARTMVEEELLAVVSELATVVSSDTIQDLFQEEMIRDGYFERRGGRVCNARRTQ